MPRHPIAMFVLLATLAGTASAQSDMVGYGPQVFDSRYHRMSFVEIAATRIQTMGMRATPIESGRATSDGSTCPSTAPSAEPDHVGRFRVTLLDFRGSPLSGALSSARRTSMSCPR